MIPAVFPQHLGAQTASGFIWGEPLCPCRAQPGRRGHSLRRGALTRSSRKVSHLAPDGASASRRAPQTKTVVLPVDMRGSCAAGRVHPHRFHRLRRRPPLLQIAIPLLILPLNRLLYLTDVRVRLAVVVNLRHLAPALARQRSADVVHHPRKWVVLFGTMALLPSALRLRVAKRCVAVVEIAPCAKGRCRKASYGRHRYRVAKGIGRGVGEDERGGCIRRARGGMSA
eukprot:CAMPEP_0206158806 /NCGR_PEP_ID=MMETSP1474-20131121/5183_1 /ASSEMBLY_ACC=CAM_ASM_001110 /TAXON_ID=97495 /ORGANISM="Imantonia sp., Strain RCC918" /LENGTH=226 /DNA_ID=CAMNT_0053559081 /DNA_START=347 /DNA_END=1024 /DNA_ORIENTATION=+